MSKQWEKNIHERFKDFQMKAPESLLDGIKAEMIRRESAITSTPKSSKHSSLAIIRRTAAIAAVFLLLFGLSYLCTVRTVMQVVSPTISESNPTIKDSSDSFATTLTESSKSAKINEFIKPIITNTSVMPMIHMTYKDSLPEKKQDMEIEEPQRQPSQATQPIKDYRQKHHSTNVSIIKTSSWATSMYYAGVISQKNINSLSNGIHTSPMHNPNCLNNAPEGALFNETMLEEKEQHHLPIHLGISVSYHLYNRWSIHSGLVYSYLSSDLSKRKQHISYQTKQKLHYIGIPLQVGYQLWSNKKLKGYLTAGGQIDKLIYGKAINDYFVNDKHQSNSIKTIKDKKLLFSVLASVGAELSLSKDFSLYIEPGLHYYFPNGNRLKTYYNEHPLNFNISIGLRFQWNQ